MYMLEKGAILGVSPLFFFLNKVPINRERLELSSLLLKDLDLGGILG
jgi:hypothetical protein